MTLTSKGSQLLLSALLKAINSCTGLTDTGKAVRNGTVSVVDNSVKCCFDTYKLDHAQIEQQKDKIVHICLLDENSWQLVRVPVQPTGRLGGAGLIFNLNLNIGGLHG